MVINKRVSVVIPVYNSQDTLIRCVESLAFGRFRNIEIILVDDKSKDNSWEICKQLSEKYEMVKCYQNDKNSGVSATRNTGLRKASGEYILFVDSDDWVSQYYAESLLSAAEYYQDAFVICGLHFINYMDGYRREYIWDKDAPNVISVENKQFFKLVEKFHIQQIWNKIYKRKIILDNAIFFDESISMGEDFQFVLDYLKTISCKKCVIINQPLYFYTRTNNNSLMSQFGLNGLQLEKVRYQQLLNISGAEAAAAYEEAIKTIEYNHAYHIAKNRQIRNRDKKRLIQDIYQDDQAKTIWKKIRFQLAKENLAKKRSNLCSLRSRIYGKKQNNRNNTIIQHEKQRLHLKRIPTIISQNCIGGVFYHDMGLAFCSPTINLYFKASDFVKFVSDLEHYLALDLKITWGEEYPVGYLDDVTIFFMHFSSCSEAQDSWNKRKARINWNNIIIFCTDRDGFSKKDFDIWLKIKYPKVLFTTNPDYYIDDSTILIDSNNNLDSVSNLIPNREFYASGKLVSIMNKRMNA